MLFVQPLIYIYEKLFGLVSDVSLLELSDTNSNLLKNFQIKLQGPFITLTSGQFAEAAANEIGANTLLVRVGAFITTLENLAATIFFRKSDGHVSPHDELAPKQSAKIIIDHVEMV